VQINPAQGAALSVSGNLKLFNMERFNKEKFCSDYSINDEQFSELNIDWDTLENIYNDYCKRTRSLEQSAIFIVNSLMKLPNVHSVRFRVKNPEHLIEKIIRKKTDNHDRIITRDNYLYEITDLIGIRVIHLFKEEWLPIHSHIQTTWNLKETPVGYYRKGDTQNYINSIKEQDCDVREHENGYRSIHYIIEFKPEKTTFYAEIQVRTIFEEGWSEIDHRIRYPYNTSNDLYNQFLLILNRLAGSADEMGTFIRNLELKFYRDEADFKKKILEKSQRIRDLEIKIENLTINSLEKGEIMSDLERISNEYDIGKQFDVFWEGIRKYREITQ